MDIFGSLKKLTSVLFTKDGFAITLRPNNSTTFTAARNIDSPAGDTDHVLVSKTSTDTLTNKTLTSPVINTPTGIVKGDVGLGNVDNTSDSTKNAASVTLTNKTLTAPILDQELFTEAAAPSTPASGKLAVYAKTDHKLYKKDSNGIESAVGSGSGSGQKNYIPNPNDAALNWTASGAGVTVTTESTASNLPDNSSQTTGVKVLRVSGTTAYAYIRFTLDAADYSKKLSLAWDQAYAGTAGDYTLAVYSNTLANYSGTSTLLSLVTSSVSAGTLSFATTFDSPSSTAPYLELRIVAVAGTTPLYLNNVTVTPGTLVQGAAISDWISFTPSTAQGFGTLTGSQFYYRRNGSSMDILGRFTSGTTVASEARIGLPTGFTVSSILTSTTQCGKWMKNNSAATAVKQGVIHMFGGHTYVRWGRDDYTTAASPFSAENGSTLSGGADDFSFFANSIPIAEWAGNGTVNLGQGAQVEYASNSSTSVSASDTTSFSIGLNTIQTITTALSRRVRFQYPIQTGDILMPQVSVDGIIWTDMDSFEITPKGSGGAYINELHRQNSTLYGFGRAQPVSGTTTDVDVSFGTYSLSNGATFASAGQSWSAFSGWYWRVRKSSASAPVGFGLASSTASGLLPATSTLGLMRYNTTNGYGSTNTCIRRFSTLVSSTSDVTYADSAAAGTSFTINTAGVYSITYTDCFTVAANFGLSKNSTQLTTGIPSITAADRLAMVANAGSGLGNLVSVTQYFAAGDVIRAHADTSTGSNTSQQNFSIQRIA
jgi:hypothetical protein